MSKRSTPILRMLEVHGHRVGMPELVWSMYCLCHGQDRPPGDSESDLNVDQLCVS